MLERDSAVSQSWEKLFAFGTRWASLRATCRTLAPLRSWPSDVYALLLALPGELPWLEGLFWSVTSALPSGLIAGTGAAGRTPTPAMGIVQMLYSHFEQLLATGLLCVDSAIILGSGAIPAPPRTGGVQSAPLVTAQMLYSPFEQFVMTGLSGGESAVFQGGGVPLGAGPMARMWMRC